MWISVSYLFPLLYQQLLNYILWGKVGKNWKCVMIVIVRSYWKDYTSPKIKSMGGLFNFNIEMKWVFLAKSIDRRARGRGFVPGSSIAGKWSRYNLCDIVTKASLAFVASTALHVHFKCCISADAKIQASIKLETEVKPVHRKTRFHSSMPCSFRCTYTAVASNRPTEALASVISFTFVVYSHYKHS